jgi:hypothetical protein
MDDFGNDMMIPYYVSKEVPQPKPFNWSGLVYYFVPQHWFAG